MTEIREDLREEALELHQEIQDYDEEKLNEVITKAYNKGELDDAEKVLEQAYGLYQSASDLAQRGISVSEEGIDKEYDGDEFPFAWDTFSEFHREFEQAFMRYVGMTQGVDDIHYDALEDMMEDEKIELPEWVDVEDIEGSELLE